MARVKIWILVVLALLAGLSAHHVLAQAGSGAELSAKSRLAVLWTSGDADVAHKVCFMYTHAAKNAKWFDEVVLIVWGPSSRLLAGDRELQAKVSAMLKSGVEVKACVACADLYGVADTLRNMGIEVKPMGRPLTEMLKGDWKVLNF